MEQTSPQPLVNGEKSSEPSLLKFPAIMTARNRRWRLAHDNKGETLLTIALRQREEWATFLGKGFDPSRPIESMLVGAHLILKQYDPASGETAIKKI